MEGQSHRLLCPCPTAYPPYLVVSCTDARGVTQFAYQLVISDQLKPGRVLYDSGQVSSNQTQYVRASVNGNAATFPPDASFDWAVRWWSSADARSVGSVGSRGLPDESNHAPASAATASTASPSPWLNSSFSTGIGSGASMSPWKGAAWIVPAKHTGNLIRKTFTLHSVPVRAALYVAAMDYYYPTVNGVAASEKMLGDFTNYEKRIWYDTHNVTAQVATGQNVVGFTVNSGWDGRHGSGKNGASVLVRLSIDMEDGTHV